MSDKDNIVQFPEREDYEDHDEHICDGCNSIHIHELSHQFTNTDVPDMLNFYYERICEAFEDDDHKDIVHALTDLFSQSYQEGVKDSLAKVLQDVSGTMAAYLNKPDGDEQ